MVSYPALLEKDPLAAFNTPTLKAELDRWETLDFSLDMDDGSEKSELPRDTSAGRRSRSTSQPVQQDPSTNIDDALLLAQFAAAGGTAPPPSNDLYSTLINYLQVQGVIPPNTSGLSLPPPNSNVYQAPPHAPGPWQQHQQSFNPSSQPTLQLPNLGLPPGTMHFQNPIPSNPQHQGHHHQYHQHQQHILPPTSSESSPTIPSSQYASSSSAQPPSPTLDDAGGITEDKRRRNTAASARFRIKKKLRNSNLEKTVSELSGRADTLEREAADLRRENGWLKEIVMLKGSRMAGIDISPHNIPSQGSSSTSRSTVPEHRSVEESDSDQDDPSSDEYQPEGKGKARAKARKDKEKRK
ncbi:hypothetical protein AAF712_001149 [Marasmius tenuissimus]|uniref:BZIP domain-containing protein n=1 Tax=Marasmius tenuissimus TaxID=585030 RepID=A0ABR3AFM6_9AGAR